MPENNQFANVFNKQNENDMQKNQTTERQKALLDDICKSIENIAYTISQPACIAAVAIGTKSGGLFTKIGPPIFCSLPHLKNSSTCKSIAFSKAGNILQTQEDRGSIQGAIRHMIWQADITANKYDVNIAQMIGNCHERLRNFNKDKRFFFDLNEADTIVDQMNNEIGRILGYKYNKYPTRELALKILENALTDGFYVVKKNNFGYIIKKIKLELELFKRLYSEYEKLSPYGLPE